MQVVDDLGTWLHENSYSLSDVAFPATMSISGGAWTPDKSIDEMRMTCEQNLLVTPTNNVLVSDSAVIFKRSHRDMLQRMYANEDGFHFDRVYIDMLAEEPSGMLAMSHSYMLLEGRVFVDPHSILCREEAEDSGPVTEAPYTEIRELVTGTFYKELEKEREKGMHIYDTSDLASFGGVSGVEFVPVFGLESVVMTSADFGGIRGLGAAAAKHIVDRLILAIHDSKVNGVMKLPYANIGIAIVTHEPKLDAYSVHEPKSDRLDELGKHAQFVITHSFAATGVKRVS